MEYMNKNRLTGTSQGIAIIIEIRLLIVTFLTYKTKSSLFCTIENVENWSFASFELWVNFLIKQIFSIFKLSVDCRSFELVKRGHSNEINSYIQDLLSSIQQQKQLVNRFHVDTFIVRNTIIIKI